MRVVVAGDSAGAELAGVLAAHLAEVHDVDDLSTPLTPAEQRYAHLTDRVANKVKDGTYERGILICGTGIGVCIAANKVPGIRAALTHDTYSAERAALSNDAHIITMGSRVIGAELAKVIADTFLSHTFDSAGRSVGNVRAIDEVEAKYHDGAHGAA